MTRPFSLVFFAALVAGLLAIGPPPSAAAPPPNVGAPAQTTFANADEAVTALVEAIRAGDLKRLAAVLGAGSEGLINSGDAYADAASREKFIAAFEARHKVTEQGPDRDVLIVGTNDWPMPIPLLRVDGRWRFDSHQGAQDIVNRRIGRNEIAAIRVALTYADAQHAYFDLSKAGSGTGEFAQRLVSTPGQHDGLYWPAEAGEPESPFGPLVAQAVEEGYPGEIEDGHPIPYQGYYFRILKAQGPHAPGGAVNYMANGKMTGGFALVAWPAIYGASGIMTFLINQDGVVFQKDLGKGAAVPTRFDPDVTWARVDVTGD